MFSSKAFVLMLLFLGQCLAFPLFAPTPTTVQQRAAAADGKLSYLVERIGDPPPPPQPTGTIIYPFYICPDGPGRGGVAYAIGDIQRAIQEAFRRHLNSEPATSSHGNQYPSVFHWEQNWLNLNRRVNTNNLIEYPLIQDGVFGPGMDAGPDRVIIDATTGTFGGVFTHRNQDNNRFVPCLGHDQDPFPPVAVFNPALVGPLPWLAGFGTGSGLDKRVVVLSIDA